MNKCSKSLLLYIFTEFLITAAKIDFFKLQGKTSKLDAYCIVVVCFGGWTGLYAMLGISFFMSIMYPTQFSLALTDLGNNTKSGSAFLVMAIVGNACLPQLTAYMMHLNEHIYHIAYTIPMICFLFCAYYGWKGYKVID